MGLDRREDPDFDEFLTGCHLVSSCSSIYHKDQFRHLLQHNFDRHYGTNRAPLTLSFDPAWLISNKGFSDVLDDWMSHILRTYSVDAETHEHTVAERLLGVEGEVCYPGPTLLPA